MQTSGPKLGSKAPTETPDTITYICNPSTPMEEMGGQRQKNPQKLLDLDGLAHSRDAAWNKIEGEDGPLTCTTHFSMNVPSITHGHTQKDEKNKKNGGKKKEKGEWGRKENQTGRGEGISQYGNFGVTIIWVTE